MRIMGSPSPVQAARHQIHGTCWHAGWLDNCHQLQTMTNNMQTMIEKTDTFLQRFTLYGLNGYKTVSLECKTRHKIVVGDNGSGKTSLLNALYSILSGKPALLYALNFEHFELEWSTGDLIKASKIELFGNLNGETIKNSLGFEFFTNNGLSEEEAIDAINLYILSDESAVLESTGYRALYRDTPYDRIEILQKFERVAANLQSSEAFTKAFQKIKELLGDTAVLYLPTYRRIEADLPEIRNRVNSPSRRMRSQKDGWSSDRLINFGLEDVEEKLNSISTTIRKDTLAAYSRISGKTLEELITRCDFKLPFHVLVVDGKDMVLGLRRLLTESKEAILGDGVAFFIDADFDGLKGHDPGSDLYITPTYSIENVLANASSLRSLLNLEFKLYEEGLHNDLEPILELYSNALTDFFQKIRNVNRLIFFGRTKSREISNCEIRTIEDSSDRFFKFNRNTFLTTSECDGEKIKDLVVFDADFDLQAVDAIDADFEKLDPSNQWRGKFHFSFFNQFLSALVEDRNSANPKYFTKGKGRIRLNLATDSAFRLLSTACEVPPCLRAFFSELPKGALH
ncbi:MAG: DUF4435 domain-containing protein [Alcaligenaceae bacterium]|nr:MAG: DUF4435 domain-containing protein [Alcaligenaceae bacterium]